MAVQTPIRGLRSFCIAAKCLSFKHAASQLFLTPSAVSHQIKQLEQQLGIILFHRQTRSIELTNAGKQFYHSIQPIIENLESTIADFTNCQQNKTITISLPEFFASELFIPKLNDWTSENPEINLQLETVKAGVKTPSTADLSIVLSSTKPNGCIITDLFPVRYVPACNKKLYRKWSSEGYDALKSVPLILHRSRPWAWHQWADKSDVYDFEPKQIIQFDSMFGVVRAAQQGMGIALIPMPISHAWFKEESLVRLYESDLISQDRYFLLRHENLDHSDDMQKFSEWIQSTFNDYW